MSIPTVLRIRGLLSNAFALLGEGVVLVDTGSPGEAHRVARALTRAGYSLNAVRLIVLTHGHADHAGSAAELRRRSGAPVAAHRADADVLRAGKHRPMTPTTLFAASIRPLVDRRFEPVPPDLELDDDADLRPFGVCARLLHTPGHTAGSITVLTDAGDACAGDLLRGGMVGGLVAPTHPGRPYYLEDPAANEASVRRLLACRPRRIYVGHGGPLTPPAVAADAHRATSVRVARLTKESPALS